jgi:release factor glutamine methyltransferase
VTVRTALLQGVEILSKADIPVPRLTAEVLLCHALHCDRTFLFSHGEDELTELAWIHYGRYLNDRLNGAPTQYVTHRQEFFGRDFYVNPDVLIPRPETEHLVEVALAHLRREPVGSVLDVGTGSGAIAITLALELDRCVLASDISYPALLVAERNRRRHRAAVGWFAADLTEAVTPSSIDLIISNPPYVPRTDSASIQSEVRDFEPHVALFGGETGLEIYQRLVAGAAVALKPGGRLLMELGYRSLGDVRAMLASRWSGLEVVEDLAGLPRVVGATLVT